jgi:ribosomal protein L36
MGLSLLVGCVGEVIVFTYADTFIKRHGVLNVFNGVFLLMGTLLYCCFTLCFTALYCCFIQRHGVLNVFNGVFLLMGTLLYCCFTRCFTAALSSGMSC